MLPEVAAMTMQALRLVGGQRRQWHAPPGALERVVQSALGPYEVHARGRPDGSGAAAPG